MTKELWINLPVKDLERSKKFFTEIGFTLNTKHGDSEVSAALLVGEKNIAVMLFTEEVFKEVVKNELADAKAGAEVLISFDAESREEADELAGRVFSAGGTIFSEPAEIQGWMYGFAFADPDDHRWNALYMDMSKMPGSESV